MTRANLRGGPLKITDVTVTRYAQSRQANGLPAGPEIQIVEVDTDEGLRGMGFLTASNSQVSPTSELLAGLLRRNLRNIVLGKDPMLTEGVWRAMYSQLAPRQGSRGLFLHAIAAIDFALWDIKAKLAGRPVGDLFGDRRQRIATYANAAHAVTPEDAAAVASEYVRKGHKAIKVRGTLGFSPLDVTNKRIEAVREAVGPDVKLMVDVNGSYGADLAIQQLKRWQKLDLYWLEEPVPPEDVLGYVRVKRHAGSTYIAGGEQHAGLTEFANLLDHDAVDIVQPGAMQVGGLTEWQKVYNLATARGIPVSPWDLQAVHMHVASGLPNVKWIEYFMPDNPMLEFQNRLFAEPRFDEEVTEDGVFLIPPAKPGLGLVLDEEEAERSLVKEP
jgi:L-alanine-DL-glutamate epimerase-like enolase superfamily enzyme